MTEEPLKDGKELGCDDDSASADQLLEPEESRDEKEEVYKMSAKDTFRVQLWRGAVTLVLLLTALAVTLTTYKLLKNEEKSNFEVAFEQFSRTLADSAVRREQNLRSTLKAMSEIISGYAVTNNLTWPFVTVPLFEMYGHTALDQGDIELMLVWNRIFPEDREAYQNWTVQHYQEQVQEGHMMRYGNLDRLNNDTMLFSPSIFQFGDRGPEPDVEREEYWTNWQMSPPPVTYGLVNWNIASLPPFEIITDALLALKNETTVTAVMPYETKDIAMTYEEHTAKHSTLKDSTPEHPHNFVQYPMHKDPTDYNSDIVGMIGVGVALDAALLNLLPQGVEGIICVIKNNMNQTFTYEITGKDAIYLGDEDMHEAQYDPMEFQVDLALHTNPAYPSTPGHCQYRMHIYPSSRFKESYDSNTPEVFAGVVATTFVLVAVVFCVYDLFVRRRNENLVSKAAQTNAIVTSLFPDNIRDRLMNENENKKGKRNLKAFLSDGTQGVTDIKSKPMADLFLETTILFADISGFTAWSSSREPTQVFVLLETLYQAFDGIAKRRRVFKVETVGDCYVAVCGLPDPREDHALTMSRFARDILGKMHALTKELEISLGPDTGDLALRVGVHSGPVTAGVLRGERARFQLFGDTMNTCARLESTGKRGRIHTSKETADLIAKFGRGAWLERREDLVTMKGKGHMTTYFINVAGDRAGSTTSRAPSEGTGDLNREKRYGERMTGLCERTHRLIDWNVEMLLKIMKQIVASRAAGKQGTPSLQTKNGSSRRNVFQLQPHGNPLDEVKEIIALPEFDSSAVRKEKDPDNIEIPRKVVEELRLLVSEVASMYNGNPFHNFDHASHVVMSVIKLMSRIVAPSHLDNMASDKAAASLHDHTYGITSDPLTQFACAFSALIHDVDHVGVSNAQLVKEGLSIASRYNERSVAEQNSLDLSWDLLMSPQFLVLRKFLFPTQAEHLRFRQLVVNSVMSTDIVDKDLKALRNARWDKAFKKGLDANSCVEENQRDAVNRKATIVIEHIIQASDISHTMQHWHVYRKWNQNLFEELYVAHLNGRMEKNPVDFWYKGEFGFFDFYIIPLTQKLKDCGVFGVSSDEYLNYAIKNREEWEAKGEEVVQEMIKECNRKYGLKSEGSTVPTGLLVPGKGDVEC